MKPKAEWEKQLQDLIRDFSNDGTLSVEEQSDILTRLVLYQRSQLLKSLVEEVEGMVRTDASGVDKNGNKILNHISWKEIGYNQALQDVIKLLKEKYKTKM